MDEKAPQAAPRELIPGNWQPATRDLELTRNGGREACEICGAALAGDEPLGLCARCLLQRGLEAALPETASSPSVPGDSSLCSPAFPRRFGQYELRAELGRGGMGIVYRAWQGRLNRHVALKMISAGPLATSAAVRRFQIEAEAAAQLDHPHIVPTYEIGELEGQHFFTMKLIGGGTIAEAAKGLPHKAIALLVSKVATAVHHAHQHGILHRDLKPNNILIDRSGEPHLTDFGLAKSLTQSNELTLTQDILGSPNYMAPEQAAGKSRPITTATDTYSLGAILYKLLTGRPPFLAETPIQTIEQVLHQEPISPRQLEASVPRDLENVCLKCLEKDPRARYPTALAVAEDLQRFVRNEPIAARPVGAPEKLWRWCRRNPNLAGLGAAVLMLLATVAVGATLMAWRIAAARDREQAARQRAEGARTLMEIQRAEELFRADESAPALAHLASVIRRDPTNRLAAERLLAALVQRNFALPLALEASSVGDLAFAPETLLQRARTRQMSAMSFDERLGAALSNNTARVFNLQTGQPVCPPVVHRDRILSVQFAADGRRLVTASQDGTARVWNLETGQSITPPLEHKDVVYAACFSPDGTRIATASKDRTARIWDSTTGLALTPPLRLPDRVAVVIFSSDGKVLATGSHDGTVRLWDAQTGQPSAEPMLHEVEVSSLWFTRNADHLHTVAQGVRQLWETRPGAATCTLLRHSAEVLCAAFAPDGQRVATGSKDGTVNIWEVQTGRRLLGPLEHPARISSLQFSPDGSRLACASFGARIWDSQTGALLLDCQEHRDFVNFVRFSPDGTLVATASRDNTARLWDARNGQSLCPPLEHRDKVFHLDFSPDGLRMATASYDSTARLWNARTGAILAPPLQHNARINCVRFSPDGLRVVTGSFDGTARVWDARTGKPITYPMRHHSDVQSACFSPDGTRVLTAANDLTARVWDAQTGIPLTQPMKHQDYVFSAEFSPDGLRVLTASWDRSARLWDAATGQPVSEPFQHSAGLLGAWFSPDGRWAVTAVQDTAAGLWELPIIKAPAPEWLPELGEAVGGLRLDQQGLLALVPPAQCLRLREQLTANPSNQDELLWAKWFLADRTERTISPHSAVRVEPPKR